MGDSVARGDTFLHTAVSPASVIPSGVQRTVWHRKHWYPTQIPQRLPGLWYHPRWFCNSWLKCSREDPSIREAVFRQPFAHQLGFDGNQSLLEYVAGRSLWLLFSLWVSGVDYLVITLLNLIAYGCLLYNVFNLIPFECLLYNIFNLIPHEVQHI